MAKIKVKTYILKTKFLLMDSLTNALMTPVSKTTKLTCKTHGINIVDRPRRMHLKKLVSQTNMKTST